MQRISCLGALLVLAVSLPAAGSTFVAMDEMALLAGADAVVRGKVVSVDSFWNDQHTFVLTEAVLEVESVVVGTAPAYVTLRTAGGTVDELTVEAPGFPTFQEGERTLVFLERDTEKPMGRVSGAGRPEAYRVTGYQLGHYRILQDPQGRELAIPIVDEGVTLVTVDGRRAEYPRLWRLNAFEERLRLLGRELGLTVPEQ